MTKRYNCTVLDRRGEFGLCMEKSTSGKFVLFSEYEKLLKKYNDSLGKRELQVREAKTHPQKNVKVITSDLE